MKNKTGLVFLCIVFALFFLGQCTEKSDGNYFSDVDIVTKMEGRAR